MRSLFCVFSVLLTPVAGAAQTWSAPEKELISHLEACWEAANVSHDHWVSVCNPASDMVFWWTAEPAPVTGLKWWKGTDAEWHAKYERTSWDVRPVAIRYYGDVGAVYYFFTQQLKKRADGEIVSEQGGSVELYRKVDGRWYYLGGMGNPIAAGG